MPLSLNCRVSFTCLWEQAEWHITLKNAWNGMMPMPSMRIVTHTYFTLSMRWMSVCLWKPCLKCKPSHACVPLNTPSTVHVVFLKGSENPRVIWRAFILTTTLSSLPPSTSPPPHQIARPNGCYPCNKLIVNTSRQSQFDRKYVHICPFKGTVQSE
jgi:hypothetical protein